MASFGRESLGNNPFERHLVSRTLAKRRSRRVLLAALSLTSMVDMFSLLVIFLLQTFSTSPELLMVTKGLTLPSARSGQELLDAPVLSLTTEGVYLDQKKLGSLDEVLKNPDTLMTQLQKLRESWGDAHPGLEFKGEINLQAHREVSSALVSKLMGLLPSQHYGSIQLIVTSGGSTG